MSTESNNVEVAMGPSCYKIPILNTPLEKNKGHSVIKPYSQEVGVPPRYVAMYGLVMSRASTKVWNQFQKYHSNSKNGESNSNSSHNTNVNGNGNGKDFKYVGI